MKPLLGWATAVKNKYRRNIYFSTGINIIVFHVFFVLVTVVIFYYTLEYVKVYILTVIRDMLNSILIGGLPDPAMLERVSGDVDNVTFFVTVGIVIFSIITGIIAAHITLIPTRKAVTAQKEFISAVAHELRTPLAILRTSNEVALYDTPADSPARDTLLETVSQTKHLTNVLDNLLVFSRVDTIETIPFSTVDCSGPLTKAIDRLEKLAHKRSITLKKTIQTNLLIDGNATALEQAFYNIIKNALTYTDRAGSSVVISAETETRFAKVTISDSGIGIEKSHLANIFTPFYRISDERGKTENMGLGLSLVYEVVKLHNGTIGVASDYGKGTTFTLCFPLAEGAVRSQDQEKNNHLFFDFSS